MRFGRSPVPHLLEQSSQVEMESGHQRPHPAGFGQREPLTVATLRRRPIETVGMGVDVTAETQRPATPFTLDSRTQFPGAGAAALTSGEWSRDFNEVKSIGAATSTSRSADQTAAAHSGERRRRPTRGIGSLDLSLPPR
jgi:hypothetical protein